MRRSLVALALAGLLLSACGDDSGDAGSSVPGSSASPQESPESSGATSSPGLAEALQFRAPLVGGGELDMSTFAGQTVAFWFWAPT